MKPLFKAILILCAGLLALKFWSSYRSGAGGLQGGSAQVGLSPNGFASIPLEGLPSDRVCIIAPQYCSSDVGRRADEITQQLESEGIPCVRVSDVKITFDQEPSKAEVARWDGIMSGRAPIIFIRGRAKNSPETSDVVAEFRNR
jgi:hypothetical protein